MYLPSYHRWDDRGALVKLLNWLTAQLEASHARPWRVADAPADYIAGLLRSVVCIEIPVTRIEGRLKASQDEARPDREGTVCGLRASGHGSAPAMADWVQNALDNDTAN